MIVQKTSHILLITLILTIAAALPRFYQLGELGFYGDEETTAMPALSVSEGHGARMPSGMPYRRAIPFTWLNAISARLFGQDQELSYRVPAAILGTLTIPLLFLMSRPLFGTATALIAALLLSFSEWHILTSREARMYAPFLFFYLATGFTIWRWVSSGHLLYLMSAMALFAITVSLHTLGMLAVIFALIPLGFIGWSRISPFRLLIFSALAAAASHLYSHYYVYLGSHSWAEKQGNVAKELGNIVADPTTTWLPVMLATTPVLTSVSSLSGAILGAYIARLSTPKNNQTGTLIRTIGIYILAILFGVFLCTAQLFGAALIGLVFLLLLPDSGNTIFRKIKIPLGLMAPFPLIWIASNILQFGLFKGLKLLVSFPFPYPVFMLQMFPGVLLLFVAIAIFTALRRLHPGENALVASILAVLLPVIAIGMVSSWGGIRYLIETYPFILLLAAAGLVKLLDSMRYLVKPWNKHFTLVAAIGLSLSGILGGHGLPQTLHALNLKYGEKADPLILTYPYYPDHQAPGLFVRDKLKADDIVIAEDSLEQWWYVRKVDYWLRDPVKHRAFLHLDQNDVMRDNYVNSIAITDDILASLKMITKQRIWLITSGETAYKRGYYLNDAQLEWLSTIEKTHVPAFIGRDGVTKVYCLNCLASDKSS